MAEAASTALDYAAIVEYRARVADAHARVALLDEVVSRGEPTPEYADCIHGARLHLEGALAELDGARALSRPAE